MEWLLIIELNNTVIKISFTSMYKYVNGEEIYKEFVENFGNVNDIKDIELKVLEIMNCYVAVRDSVYMLCDIRSDTYNFIVDAMPKLFSRTKSILDLNSFNIAMKLKKIKN
jgi:hypothetical protein